jgi:hypothetical protein
MIKKQADCRGNVRSRATQNASPRILLMSPSGGIWPNSEEQSLINATNYLNLSLSPPDSQEHI